jgi:hypothetical protein
LRQRGLKAAVEKLASLRGTIEVSEGYDVYILISREEPDFR